MARRTPTGICAIAAVAAFGGPAPAQLPEPRVEIAAQWSRNPAWSLREMTGTFVNRDVTIPAGTGVGARVRLRVLPVLGIFADGYIVLRSGDNSDLSGYSAWRGGAELRWPPGRRWTPFIDAAIGRLRESGGVHFTQGAIAGGVEFRPARILAFRAAAERVASLGGVGTGGPPVAGRTVTVDAAGTRWLLGAAIGFGH